MDPSAVDRPWKLKFLGFSFCPKKGEIGIRVHPKPIARFKQRLKEITGRSNAMSMYQRMVKLRQTKHDNLLALGVPGYKAWEHANTR